MHLHYGVIVFVLVIRMDELQLRSEIALPHNFKALDLLRPVVLGIPRSQVRPIRIPPLSFPNPGRRRLKPI